MTTKHITFAEQDKMMEEAETMNTSSVVIGTFWLDIWEGSFGLVGEEITRDKFEHKKWFYGDMFQVNYFRGKRATIVTVSDMRYISRDQALWFATKFVKGEYKTIHVDLKALTSFTVEGVPINPHQ